METKSESKINTPPGSKDLEGWRRAIAEGLYSAYPPEALIAALQDLGSQADVQIRNALAKVLSDDAIKRLRRRVGYNHPNEGWDIIWRTHEDLFKAIGKPRSKDGKGFRKAYATRLTYRLKDAIAKEIRERRSDKDIIAEKTAKAKKEIKPEKIKQLPAEAEEEDVGNEGDLAELDSVQTLSLKSDSVIEEDDTAPIKAEYDPELLDEVNAMLEQIDVDRLLKECIPNEQKRLAFYLFMDDVPYKSKRKATTHSIADALGIDESTARDWIKEVQEILKEKVRSLK